VKNLYFLSVLFIVMGTGTAAQKQAQERLPYAAIHDPQFISASSAAFLHNPDRVIGVVSGPVAKAYPAAILSQHGLVEDQSPSGPIAITW
jgi:Protein of unknown function (DUF3179)